MKMIGWDNELHSLLTQIDFVLGCRVYEMRRMNQSPKIAIERARIENQERACVFLEHGIKNQRRRRELTGHYTQIRLLNINEKLSSCDTSLVSI
jgi:hypothetical protein